MEEFFLSIAIKIGEYTVAPILHHAKYLCCFNNFAANLPIVKEDLESTQDSVKKRAEEAINRTERIEPTVEKWLKDVEEVLEEVKILEARISKVSKSYLRRQCQYSLAKEIERIKEKMTQLILQSEFKSFSKPTELPGMHYYSSKDFVFFESTKSAYNKLLEALKDESVGMIGLVGMGGSGKTTLAKEVGKKAEELKLFEKVVMTTVSQTLNIKSIQEEIADKLSVTFQQISDQGRAQKLSQRLKEGRTLLILDDVWEKINFEALGIPFHENKGCRVLLTTRERVVCNSMQCQSTIELNLLTDKEAWSLFTTHANIDDNTPTDLKFVAEKIVNECKGLPIAIVTLGSTLRKKNLEEWKFALSKLEVSEPLDIPKGLTSPHVCLKLSYDNLTNQLARSLLLLCSIFPEDHEIDLEDLFRFGKGWSLTRTFGTLEKARGEMNIAVNMLKDSCLLLPAKYQKVKMHDMVRDVALWIASERGQTILASTVMDLRMSVEDETIQDKRVISLWDLQTEQLPFDQLNCPSLQILLLHSQKVGFEVSNSCFERLKQLKILAFLTFDYEWKFSDLSSLHTLSLPQSIELLKNLHTLCLRGYKLGDISILVKLEALEILDLRGSVFEKLPDRIVALKKLKLLDLYNCWIKEDNAYEVIRRCLQLEELYLGLFQPKENFPHNASLPRFQRYAIFHNSFLDVEAAFKFKKYRPSRALLLEGFDASAESFMKLPIKDLFLRADYLHLRYLKGGYKNVITFIDPQGMNQLIVLILKHCPEIECLFNSTTLRLQSSNSLQEVFHDPSSQLHSISFPRNSKLSSLKELTISHCPMLSCLFMPSIAQTLVLLESLYISECSGLKNIIEEVEEGDIDGVSSQSHTSLMLPKLKYLKIDGCKKLEYVFPVCIAQSLENLEYVNVSRNREMKYIFGSEKEHQSHHETNTDINLLKLDILELYRLPNLIGIWPNYCRSRLPNLRHLLCYKCSRLSNLSAHAAVGIDSDLQRKVTVKEKEKVCIWVVASTFNQLPSIHVPKRISDLYLGDVVGVKGIYEFQIGEANTNTQIVPFNFNLDLSQLNLWNLPELQFIWKGPTNFLNLHMLQRITLGECPKLRSIFSPTIVTSLPMLSDLYISKCEELEQIFDSQQLKTLYTCSQHVCFPQLTYITIRYCNKLKYLFHNFVAAHFPSLMSLEIEECYEIEKGFDFEYEADDDGDDQQGPGKDGQQLPLQNLKNIRLTSLPKFKEIHCGFKLKDDVEPSIQDCPKYSSNLYLYPDDSISAQSH